MEGPTPVSALIHAATMVTAGVYMVTRTNAIFQLAPLAMAVVAMVGAATAIFAATMGVVQNRHQESAGVFHRSRSSATCSWPAAWAHSPPEFST